MERALPQIKPCKISPCISYVILLSYFSIARAYTVLYTTYTHVIFVRLNIELGYTDKNVASCTIAWYKLQRGFEN